MIVKPIIVEQDVVRVELADRAYDIIIGEGLLADAGAYLGPVLARPRVVIISDITVAGLHLAPLQASLAAAGIRNDVIIIPPGEASKNFAQLQSVLACQSLTPPGIWWLISVAAPLRWQFCRWAILSMHAQFGLAVTAWMRPLLAICAGSKTYWSARQLQN